MAQRRMISRDLHENPGFESMSVHACFALDQMHLYADDDGYIKIADALYRGRCDDSVIQEILNAGWIEIKNGIIKILEWQTFQNIKKDRYTPSALKNYFSGKQTYKSHFPVKASHAQTGEISTKDQQKFFDNYSPESERSTDDSMLEDSVTIETSARVANPVSGIGFKKSAEILANKMKVKSKRGGAKKEWQSNCARWLRKVNAFKDEDYPVIYKIWGENQHNEYLLESIMTDIIELKPSNPLAYFLDLYEKKKKSKK